MASQKFMGRNQLINRLSSQVGSTKSAVDILIKRGHLTKDGKHFTKEGAARNSMTASERAIDRAVKKTGKNISDFKYNEDTNNAVLR